ncbi:hypothetical protein SEMRO_975_G226870.1 [Seminavis robusta]|uniref:Uncharacterized protein n=1 Tax=Seminavis robusta TaxID=568900 RepID=A0A9N8ECK3_9STRA|nr:hypothetical protein SEMRO_975_G226870.1 [Seminavis robusta]|eukprot:Sro975_g226870.1 n/a (341) ;mRNA; f:34940-36124
MEEAGSGDLPMEDCGLNLPASHDTGVSKNKSTDDGTVPCQEGVETTGLVAVNKNVFGLIRPASTDTKNQSNDNDMHQPRDGQAATTSPDLSTGQASDHSAFTNSRASTSSPGLSSGQADNIAGVSEVPDIRASTGSPDDQADNDVDRSVVPDSRSPGLSTDKAHNNVDYCSPDHLAVPEARRVAEAGKLATSQLLHSRIGVTRKEINQDQAWKSIGLTKKFGSGAGLAPNKAYLSVEAGSVALDEDTPGMLTVTFLLPGPERIKVKEQLESLGQNPIALFWTEAQLESSERLWHYIGHYQCAKIWEEDVTFSASFCWEKFNENVATKLDEIAAAGASGSH